MYFQQKNNWTIQKIFDRTIVISLTAFILHFPGPALAGPAALIDVKTAKNLLDEPHVVFLDAQQKVNYAIGHIPGAVHTDLDEGGWREDRNGIPFMLPKPDTLAKLIGSLGISNDDHVVLISSGNTVEDIAKVTRLYWTFITVGHNRVSILDGGVKAWKKAGEDLTTETYIPLAKQFKVSFLVNFLASENDVEERLSDDQPVIDLRSFDKYSANSKSEICPALGTIPRAINIPATKLIDQNSGFFKSTASLRQSFDKVEGLSWSKVVAFSDTGLSATIGWFVLHAILKHDQVKLYDGSMIEWALKDNPISDLSCGCSNDDHDNY